MIAHPACIVVMVQYRPTNHQYLSTIGQATEMVGDWGINLHSIIMLPNSPRKLLTNVSNPVGALGTDLWRLLMVICKGKAPAKIIHTM